MRYTGFHRAVQILHGEVRQRWQISFTNLIDLTELVQLREHAVAVGVGKPSYTACVVKAAAMAINELQGQYPELNAMVGRCLWFHWLKPFQGIAAGVAVSREEEGADRIFVRVLAAPQTMSLAAITSELHAAATRPAKELEDYQACQDLYRKPGFVQRVMLKIGANSESLHRKYRGTFSLTTVGKFGVDTQLVMPLTTPIQFGFGSVKERPIVRDGQVVASPTVYLTVAFDRRILNGKPVGALIERVCHILATNDDGNWRGEVEAEAGSAILNR